jgi:2-polyprenyl-3-methyl-5-hydroxy-6-metoxy-1,4-benzoquinol methylase
VDWIFDHVLGGQPARVLDLGCGPGLYTQRLATLGCDCAGIDYAPAAIDYARSQAAAAGLPIAYQLADMRQADYGEGFDLVMLVYGEPNVFGPDDLRRILRQAHAALRPGGQVLLEPHTMEAVEDLGRKPAGWSAQSAGLFAAEPHLLLTEAFWEPKAGTATLRYYVVDAATAEVTRYAQSMQSYSEAGYRDLLASAGFGQVRCYPSLTGEIAGRQSGLFALTAVRE